MSMAGYPWVTITDLPIKSQMIQQKSEIFQTFTCVASCRPIIFHGSTCLPPRGSDNHLSISSPSLSIDARAHTHSSSGWVNLNRHLHLNDFIFTSRQAAADGDDDGGDDGEDGGGHS
ncbi:hypothetical protein OIU85_016235 [Salix viminalis]|uniref:Uncharacterized protein n=1 Tax=Salix viminalis TaxID=40686 RepID=A0A9Q0V6S0_SALVM|nr:hypothetical protein OIU85_016235 [Salix viminalis]